MGALWCSLCPGRPPRRDPDTPGPPQDPDKEALPLEGAAAEAPRRVSHGRDAAWLTCPVTLSGFSCCFGVLDFVFIPFLKNYYSVLLRGAQGAEPSAPPDIQLAAFMPQNLTITQPHQTFLIACSRFAEDVRRLG